MVHVHQHNKQPDNKIVNSQNNGLLGVTILNLLITVVQIFGGVISNSLSLLSDALHNLADSSATIIALLAGKHSTKKPDYKNTFGYKRTEILAALFNAVVLVAICIFLFYEAYKRLVNPEQIKGGLMLIVAVFGLLANLASVIILHKFKSHNLNVRAAYLHLLGDTLSSVAVIIGGLAIWLFKIYWIDPLITILVGLYIIKHTWAIVTETVDILMQAVPKNIDIELIKQQIELLPHIDNIHHVHVWKLNDTQIHFEAHINVKNNIDMLTMMQVHQNAETLLKQKFGIEHVTLQFGYNCCNGNNKLLTTM